MSKPQKNCDIIMTAIGNPVVDVQVMIPDAQFFAHHNLPLNGQRPESAEFLATLEEDFKRRNYQTMIHPGGCAQNTSRVFQWLMKSESHHSCMIGSVGNDDKGAFLISRLEEHKVKPCLVVLENWRTFSVFVFVHGNSRFIAYPGYDEAATAQYSLARFLSHEDALRAIENSLIVFIEGFFTEHSPQVALKILDMSVDAGIVTTFNICGTNVVERYFEQSVEPFLRKSAIVVGNLQEFESVCAKLNVPVRSGAQAVIEVHKLMMSYVPTAAYRLKSMERYKKILVVTNGEQKVYCVTDSDGFVDHVPPSIEPDKIKDTTGAGDAFIAGLLFGLVKEQPITRCLDIACRVAGQIIQQNGVTIPKGEANFVDDDVR